jgi:hypothetical protein
MVDEESPMSVSLREYVDVRLEAIRESISVRLDGADRAVVEAERKLDVRLEHSNDLAQKTQVWMQEARETMVQQVEYKHLSDRVRRMEEDVSRIAGERTGGRNLVAVILIVVAAVVSAVVTKLTSV